MRYLTTCAAVLVLTGLSVAAPAAEPVEVEGVDLDSDAQSASRFKYYTMPTSASGPCDITTGPDGNIWVQDFLVNKIARINVETNKITEFDIPYTKLPLNIPLPGQAPGRSGLTACAIQPGKDGNLYAATGVRNQFLKIDLSKATPKIKVFDTGDPTTNPTGNLQPFNDLWRGDEGMYFTQTTGNKICQQSYKTEKITCWSPPTIASGPLGLFVASDNLLWFTEFFANKVGSFNQTSHEFKEYKLPGVANFPAVTRAETRLNGQNYLWVNNFATGGMSRVNIKTGATKIYPGFEGPLTLPVENDADSFGRLWYSSATSNSLNVLNPFVGANGNTRVIKQPGTIVNPGGVPPAANIAIHYGPKNRMWFTQLALNRVGSYQLLGCGNNIKKCTK